MQTGFRGGCLCGAVRFHHDGPLRPVVACHCSQCRRTSGHHVAATCGERGRLRLESELGLSWYESSPRVFRGFCNRCGSSLFWMRSGSATMSIMAGSLDRPTGLRLIAHIYTADAGDYYQIDSDLPQHEQWAPMPDFPAAASDEEKG